MKKEKPKIMVKPGTYGRGARAGQPLKVRLPPAMGGTLMKAEGMEVPDDAFWRRRLRGGDVVASGKASAPAPTAAPAKTSSKKGKE